MAPDFDVIIVGAGPYGLSSAVYLKNRGAGVGVFGDPMSFWQNHMPAGMYMRSNWPASNIADPRTRLTLDHFKAETGQGFSQPIPLEDFVAYGKWFQQKAVSELSSQNVASIEQNGTGFKVQLSDGSLVKAPRVIVATGIAPFPWMPAIFRGLPKSHITHSSDHPDLSRFASKRVLIVGGGQSALDAARIISGFDGDVEVVAKQKVIRWVGQNKWLHHLGLISWCLYSNFDVGPAGISRLVGFPNLFRKIPRILQDPISRRAIRPAGTGWQKPYLTKVRMTVDCQVVSAEVSGELVHLRLSDGSERMIDHVIIATGYQVDCGRYAFLSQGIRDKLKTVSGSPVLDRGFESSVSGLHFVGKPAAWSFGPLLNFISGTNFAGPELIRKFRRS